MKLCSWARRPRRWTQDDQGARKAVGLGKDQGGRHPGKKLGKEQAQRGGSHCKVPKAVCEDEGHLLAEVTWGQWDQTL